MENTTPSNIFVIITIVLCIYLLIKTKITHGEISVDNITNEIMKLVVYSTFFLIILVVFYYAKEIISNDNIKMYQAPKHEKVINKEIQRLSDDGSYYNLYFIDMNNGVEEFQYLNVPKDKANISFSKSKDEIIRVDYNLKLSNKNPQRVLDSAENELLIKLPEGYQIERFLFADDINDLKYKHVKINECSYQVKYENNTYSFYVIKDFLIEINFKEQNGVKLKLIKGDTGKYKACLNLDYYQTLNGEFIQKPNHIPSYEMTISNDFKLD